MSSIIKSGKFVIIQKTENGKRLYWKNSLWNDVKWTDKIKEAAVFETEKLAIMNKYANDLEHENCSVIELISKKEKV